MDVVKDKVELKQELVALATEVKEAWADFLKETDPDVKAARKERWQHLA